MEAKQFWFELLYKLGCAPSATHESDIDLITPRLIDAAVQPFILPTNILGRNTGSYAHGLLCKQQCYFFKDLMIIMVVRPVFFGPFFYARPRSTFI